MNSHRLKVYAIKFEKTRKHGARWVAIGKNTRLNSKELQHPVSKLRAHRLITQMTKLYGQPRHDERSSMLCFWTFKVPDRRAER